ncbi:MAG: o-succinylbenzoate synthase [Anaerolineae bacterium]|nr:o-succinylbenzoate synthase [Anaerolineae bacterium]
MAIERIELHHLGLELAHPFETSVVREVDRPLILVAVYGGGLAGWGECSAEAGPWHSAETIETAWHVLRTWFIPALLGRTIASPADALACFPAVRGHHLARAGLENALWDLLARANGLSLAQMLGGTRDRVPVGVSVGMEATLPLLLDQVACYVAAGYRRVKLKIKPGWDGAVVRAVRERWPDLLLQVDANCAYTLADLPVLRELDQFGLLLIEQPFHHDDLLDHARLQKQIKTPVCLDESIQSPAHARWALELDACRVINIKVGRVGGLTAARQIHDLCAAHGIAVWCGGMLECNVGRAANVALASLPGFTLAGDISASARYYRQDVAEPNFVLNPDSTLSVPAGPGLGVDVLPARLAAARLRSECFQDGVGL